MSRRAGRAPQQTWRVSPRRRVCRASGCPSMSRKGCSKGFGLTSKKRQEIVIINGGKTDGLMRSVKDYFKRNSTNIIWPLLSNGTQFCNSVDGPAANG